MVTKYFFGNKNIENKRLDVLNTQSAPGSYAGATKLDLESKSSTNSLLDTGTFSHSLSARSSPLLSASSHDQTSHISSLYQACRFTCDNPSFSSSTTAIQLNAETKPVFLNKTGLQTADRLAQLPKNNSTAGRSTTFNQHNNQILIIGQKPESASSNLPAISNGIDETTDTIASMHTNDEISQLSMNETSGDDGKPTFSHQQNSSWWNLFYSTKSYEGVDQKNGSVSINSAGSWISPLWTLSSNQTSSEETQQKRKRKSSADENSTNDQTEIQKSGVLSPPPSPTGLNEPDTAQLEAKANNAGRSWAFWTRSADKDSEFSVAGTSTETHPLKARRIEASDEGNDDDYSKEDSAENLKTNQNQKSKKSGKEQPVRPNIVAPTPDMCYPLYSSVDRLKSSLIKLAQYMSPGTISRDMVKEHEPLFRTSPKRVSRVVVIGVHGFFPTKVIRAVLGEPTGTSIKFANEAAKSVERWANEKGFQVHIEKIALEGEGKILKRVDTLYQLLSNWLHLIHEADFIYFAAHSQGTPVAVHLLARLVEEGHVEKKVIGVLGMAGISLGPISGLDQKLVMRAISQIESASLRELFEFQKLDSRQSKKYIESLRTIIAHNVKIVFVGSLNDQLVPLYSSTCAHISHPNVYRAVFVDSEAVSSDFISTVISIALRLRNIGSADHGFIREVSAALPGTLTSGGHSRLYDEGRVYDLLIRHALETTDAPKSLPLKVDSTFDIPKDNNNPYLLPWSMRGLINEALMRPSFGSQLNSLHEEFTNWKPDSKQMKDLKYRLSAIQSRL